jgi:hypothetical protein
MNKTDVSFTVGLDTSPAEQQLNKFYEKLRSTTKTSPLLQQVANEYSQGFKMVGSAYDSGSNRFEVPSTQVLNTALVSTTQTLRKFESTLNSVIYMSSRILDDYLKKATQPQLGYSPSSFTEYRSNAYSRLKMVGNPYSTNPNLIGDTYDGYMVGGNNYGVPSTIVNSGGLVRTGRNVSNWSPSEFYTRDQADAINYNISHNDIFNRLLFNRNAGKPFSETYDIFSQIHSPMGAMGMYSIWSNLFGNKSPIGIEAPKHVWTGADGIDTPEEQGKDIVDQEKKDNDELKEKLLLWGKISATIYAIRKVISGLAKLWRFGTETVSGVNSNINEEHGFFSIDPEGALRANSDKARAMLYAGIRNMGENAPVSKAGLDYASSKMTEMWTAAMSGRDVDARTTIDVQRLKDFFGIDLTVAGLLTGEREGKTATDIQIDMMDKVEKQISKLAEADEITKGQVIDSLKNILGDELVNAIVANANKNLKIDATDLKFTLSDLLMNAGGSAIPSGNLTEQTTKAVTAISEFKESLQTLKNTIISSNGINDAFVKLILAIKSITDWLTRKLNSVEGEKNALGEAKNRVSISSLTSEEVSRYRNFKQKEDDTKDVFKNKANIVKDYLKSGNVKEILSALYLSQPEVRSAADIENLGIKQKELEVGLAIKNRTLDKASDNPIIRALANYKYKNPNTGEVLEGFDALATELATNPDAGWALPEVKQLFTGANMSEYDILLAMRNFAKLNPTARDAFSSAFDKNGIYDYGTDKLPIDYLYGIRMLGSPEEQFKAYKALAKESYKVLDNTVNLEVEHNDKNKNGVVDAGEVVLTVVVKDQYNNETRKTVSADLL